MLMALSKGRWPLLLGAVVVAVGLAGCGKSDQKSDSSSTGTNSPSASTSTDASTPPADTALAKLKAEMEAPVYFALSNHSLCKDGNGNFQLTARLIAKSDVNLNALQGMFSYPGFDYPDIASQSYFLSMVLTRLPYALNQEPYNCSGVSDTLLAKAITPDIGSGTTVFRMYDLGGFVLNDATKTTEAPATDPRTGAATKLRVYRLTIGFKPSSTTIALGVSGLSPIYCTVSLMQNPATLEWEHTGNGVCSNYPG